MSAPFCTICLDTGSKSQEIDGFLDCVACNAVTNRLEMQNYLAGLSPLMNSEQRAWAAYNFGMRKTAAPVVPVAAQPAWKALSDVQWMNIVNHDHAYAQYSKDDAVHTAVKMTEAKCKELNAAPQPAASVTDVARDAARYKFLCRAAFDASMAQEEIDKEVDAAIAAQQGEKTK